jgi:hypothetical protein
MPCQSTVQHKKSTVKNEINLQTKSWASAEEWREEGRQVGARGRREVNACQGAAQGEQRVKKEIIRSMDQSAAEESTCLSAPSPSLSSAQTQNTETQTQA